MWIQLDASEFGEVECDDGIDNDTDGLIDFPNDPECILPVSIDESVLSCVETDPTLLARWKLDEEIAGSVVADSSPRGNDGFPAGGGGGNNLPQPSTNTSEAITFPNEGSLDFDGSDDRIDVSVPLPDAYTISLWIHPEQFSDSWGSLLVQFDGLLGLYFYQNSRLIFYDGRIGGIGHFQ